MCPRQNQPVKRFGKNKKQSWCKHHFNQSLIPITNIPWNNFGLSCSYVLLPCGIRYLWQLRGSLGLRQTFWFSATPSSRSKTMVSTLSEAAFFVLRSSEAGTYIRVLLGRNRAFSGVESSWWWHTVEVENCFADVTHLVPRRVAAVPGSSPPILLGTGCLEITLLACSSHLPTHAAAILWCALFRIYVSSQEWRMRKPQTHAFSLFLTLYVHVYTPVPLLT